MTGTYINVAAVAAGSVAGALIGSRLPERVRETVMHVIGLFTIVLGTDMALKSEQPLVFLISLILGGLLGEAIGLEKGIEWLGARAERLMAPRGRSAAGEGRFATGFVSSSVLFCVGPITLLGCLQDGLGQGFEILAVKSTLDGISSIALASIFGWGVALSTVTVLTLQGGLTLSAQALEPFLGAPAVQNELFATGGVLMLGLGLRLLELKRIRVANLLPALALAPLLYRLAAAYGWIAP